jgi:hypothetical protein
VEVDLSDGLKESLCQRFTVDTLHFPDRLLPQEKQAAFEIISGSHDPQILLDELSGQMAGGRIANALGYLRALRKKQQANEFVPELAYRIAAERQRRLEILRQREAALRKSPAGEETKPVSPEVARRSIAELRQRLWGNKKP